MSGFALLYPTCELQIYEEKYNLNLERDVQDLFITSMTIEDGRLLVTNERDETFEVNLKTKHIRKVK